MKALQLMRRYSSIVCTMVAYCDFTRCKNVESFEHKERNE